MKLDSGLDKQIAEMNLNSRILEQRRPINRFVLGSVLLHILSAATIVVGSQYPQPKPEVVEIDFSSVPVAKVESAPIQAPEIQEAAPALIAPPQSAPAEPATKIQEVKPVIAKAELPIPQPKPVEPKAAPIVEKSVVPTAAIEQNEPEPTLDDIETPTLDDSEFVTALKKEKAQPTVSKAEIEEKLKKAEQAQAEKAALMAQQLEQDTNSTEQSLNDQLSETELAVAKQNEALTAQAEARAASLKAQQDAAAKAQTEADARASA